jgi:hypothetical protein
MDTSAPLLTSARPASRTEARAPLGMARLAGALYLVIAVAAGVAHFYVPSQLIVPGDAAATAAAIEAAPQLFRLGIGAELVVLLSEVALSVLLYVLLRPVSKTLALVASAFRLTMTAIHAMNMTASFAVLHLVGAAGGPPAFAGAERDGLVQLLLAAYADGFTLGIVFLIPHVFVLGYLIVASGYFPRALGVLFLLAGCGYLFDVTGQLFVPAYGATPAPVALLIAAAEVAFPLWLVARGLDAEGWRRSQAGPSPR